jgi:hypothetical protein
VLVLAVIAGAGHLSAFANWDGAWYGSIVQHGYEYAPDGRQHNAAFFPLLPLLAWPLVHAGMPWPLAAALIVNAAFLAALFVVRALSRKHYDEETARWCVMLACVLPPSLFCSVAYPQSVFLLASAAALYLFERDRFVAGGSAGAFASVASPLGIPLLVAMMGDALARRRALAFAGAAIALCGIGGFVLYCQQRFGDPLAFVHAQHGWRTGFGFDVSAWHSILTSLSTLDGFRQNVMMLLVPLGVLAVIFEGRRLGRLMTIYALCALGVLLFSGTPFSVDRNAYAIAPVLIGIAAILRRVPIAGYPVLAVSLVLLIVDAGRFARFEWVA